MKKIFEFQNGKNLFDYIGAGTVSPKFLINKLYEDGNTIIFNTARGFVTKINWTQETRDQLKEWGVKYHELHLTKPHADIYIDDKGVKDLDFFIQFKKKICKTRQVS